MIDINLIPPNIKEEIRLSKANRKTLGYFWKSFFITLFICTLFVSAHIYFTYELSSKIPKQKKAEEKLEEYAQTEAKAKSATQKINKIKKIDDSRYIWSNLLTEVEKITPANVKVLTMNLDSEKKSRASLRGSTLTKKDVADFRTILESSNYFEFVDIDNTQNNGDTENFDISLTISESALK